VPLLLVVVVVTALSCCSTDCYVYMPIITLLYVDLLRWVVAVYIPDSTLIGSATHLLIVIRGIKHSSRATGRATRVGEHGSRCLSRCACDSITAYSAGAAKRRAPRWRDAPREEASPGLGVVVCRLQVGPICPRFTHL